MRKAICRAILFALPAIVFASAPAGAAPPPNGLWATVNYCNTPTHPDRMGVWASMPGDGTRHRMFMRFHAQYYNPTTKKWFQVKNKGVSPWYFVGTGRATTSEFGYTFSFSPPRPGTMFVLRGVVDFQWRARKRTKSGKRTVVVRTLHANTKGNHPAHGADPPGYSSGTCEIK